MKKDKHPARKGKIKKSLYKLLTLFIIIVLICIGCGIFYAKDLTYGYKYYETNTLQPIAVTQQENFFYNTVETFLAELEEKGYYIVSFEVNLDTICKHTVIKKSEINDDYFKNQIISSLNIDIFTTKLTIKDDNTIYYFTTEDKCKEFINELNKYITQDYNIESSIEDYSIITSQNVLDTKLNNVIEQKKQKDAEEAAKKKAAAKKKQVTSRGGTTIRKSNYSNGVPMAAYTYISSYYGMRNGRMHTGVDFAAPQGTTIYA
ncbi:MAG: M23 family metallopeptidase [Bacilli bacterium]